jgi:L-aspartate oxidase
MHDTIQNGRPIDWKAEIPRYLLPVDLKSLPHYFVDCLVIGGGLSGLRAANEIDSTLRTIVVTKDELVESNSSYAQGGIASVWDPTDRFDNHIRDTLTAGGLLCDPDVVKSVVEQAPRRIEELIEWGTRFDELGGELILGREGGHSHQRIIHALGDATGKEIMRAIIAYTRSVDHIDIWEKAFTIDLLTHEGRCYGAIVSRDNQAPCLVWANQTLLCTGGCGQVFRESTNPAVATGDGHAIAFRAGARLRDMEFMQFHPTVLYIAGSSRTLITEAVRGEGAYLVDCNGHRFMADYDDRMELAPRDIVSQSIVQQMEKTQHPCVYLTLEHLDSDHVRKRFPGIAKVCEGFALDIASDKIPVRPGAHYMLGGVVIDQDGRTSLPGLLAAGEVSSSGLHGANRLASNSLLEGLVYGVRAGRVASDEAFTMRDQFGPFPIEQVQMAHSKELFDASDVRNSLKSLMWRNVGVERSEQPLASALETIRGYSKYVLRQPFDSQEGWELQNLLTVSMLMTWAALTRRESRGVHLRTDFPELDAEHWQHHLDIQR